jgi:transposase-like protein
MHKRSIGPRPQSRSDLASWYGAILEQHADSGLSLKAYAERVGISAWTLYDWRRRLERDDDGEGGGEPMAQEPTLVEIAVTSTERGSTTGLVVRVNEDRRSIVVPAGFDGDELRRVVTVLESC